MKNIIITILALFCIYLIFQNSQTNNNRYTIFQHPIIRADQFLLDTKTGRTWQMTEESTEKYMFWHEIPRDEFSLPKQQNQEEN